MAPYFRADATVTPNDLGLLPKTLRIEPDLVALAEAAEALVIDFYTYSTYERRWRWMGTRAGDLDIGVDAGAVQIEATADGFLYVMLRGYTVDADANLNATFKQAMRREIAATILWLRARWRSADDENLTSRSEDNGARTYRADAQAWVRPGMGRFLRHWSLRRVAYTI